MALIPDTDQRTPEWFAVRSHRVTASLAAACLGLDPDTGPITAWKEIMGLKKQPENPFITWGIQNERAAREAYEVETGYLAETTGFWVDDAEDWLGASPDGLVETDGLVEMKCPQIGLPTAIPQKHLIQIAIQLRCTNRLWCDYFAWHPEEGHFLERVHRSFEEEAGMVEQLRQWHLIHVQGNVAPARRKPARKEIAR